jgi:hypothetical protein
MGGSGSGSWYRWNKKMVVEDGFTLDISKLIRGKNIIPSQHISGSLIWRSVRTGEEKASLGYEANMLSPYSAWLRLFYKHDGIPEDYKIQLTVTSPYYGGMRWWFICPAKGTRAAKLCLPPGGNLFASRAAYRLGYQSQQENTMYRNLTQAQNIREQLGGSGCMDEWIPEKPKGMHWKTYEKLRAKCERYEQRCNAMAAHRFGLGF